jgi:hypothetical protein
MAAWESPGSRDAMTYELAHSKRQESSAIRAWLLLAFGLFGIGYYLFFQLSYVQKIAQALPLRAKVVGYEKHGFPEPKDDYLRLQLLDGPSKSANVAIEVSRSFREFKEGEEVQVFYRVARSTSGAYRDYYILADARYQLTAPLIALMAGGAAFCVGLAFHIKLLRPKASVQA